MNDLTISTIQAVLPPQAASAAPAEATTPFSDYVRRSVEAVNQQMLQADHAIEDLATGKRQDIHGTMIEMKKAEIAFGLVLEIRNKLMTAYDEIRRMPI